MIRAARISICILLSAIAGGAIVTSAQGDTSRRNHGPSSFGPSYAFWLVHVDPGEPPTVVPPQMWLDFQRLLYSYMTVGSRIPVSFQQWLLMNGVKDPGQQAAYMLMYDWYVRQAG